MEGNVLNYEFPVQKEELNELKRKLELSQKEVETKLQIEELKTSSSQKIIQKL